MELGIAVSNSLTSHKLVQLEIWCELNVILLRVLCIVREQRMCQRLFNCKYM